MIQIPQPNGPSNKCRRRQGEAEWILDRAAAGTSVDVGIRYTTLRKDLRAGEVMKAAHSAAYPNANRIPTMTSSVVVTWAANQDPGWASGGLVR